MIGKDQEIADSNLLGLQLYSATRLSGKADIYPAAGPIEANLMQTEYENSSFSNTDGQIKMSEFRPFIKDARDPFNALNTTKNRLVSPDITFTFGPKSYVTKNVEDIFLEIFLEETPDPLGDSK